MRKFLAWSVMLPGLALFAYGCWQWDDGHPGGLVWMAIGAPVMALGAKLGADL